MKHFNLFSTILITKGARRTLISDIHRNVSEVYPLELYEILEELKSHSIEGMMKNYDKDSRTIVHEYINMLLEKEYGFITENDWDLNFPPLSYEYHEPSVITNIFIEMDDIEVLKTIYSSIENLRIKQLVIYSIKPISVLEFIEIDNLFKTSILSGIEIFSPFHHEINHSFIEDLQKNTLRIYSLVFFNSSKPFIITKDKYRFTLNFLKDELKISACGKIEMKSFNTNISKVLEAINHNSCLHKKIGIDKDGNIKNCPLMPEYFGNIQDISLDKALEMPGFKKYWNLTKDNIEICKDCEFRLVCTDCRAYTERTHIDSSGLDISKPLKCGYDPYTGIWEDWSTNPLKFNSIKFYELENLN